MKNASGIYIYRNPQPPASQFDLPYFVGQEKVDEWEREIREAVRRESEAIGVDPEQVMRVLRCE